MNKHMLIWDLDDTLIFTNSEYNKTNNKAAEIIAQAIYGDTQNVSEIKKLQNKLDLEMVKEYGYVPARYIKSWISTYVHICTEHGANIVNSVIQSVQETVENLYVRRFENVPEAREVLTELKREGYPMVLLTAGDYGVQSKRVREAELEEFFIKIHVYPFKTPETLKELLDLYPAEHRFMIGNSLKSDIYPALENGIWGIHMVRETWEADHHDIDKANKLYLPIQNLREVKNLVESMENREIA